jgi:hypothetical protein
MSEEPSTTVEQNPEPSSPAKPSPRLVVAPQPLSPPPEIMSDEEPLPPPPIASEPLRPAGQERTLARSHQAPTPAQHRPSGFQRAMGVMLGVLPVVQKILPLLDGNIASAVSNFLGPTAQSPASRASLVPLENALGQLHAGQLDLRDRIAEQNSSLQRVADHLELVKEATDRNTLEQQELMADLRKMRRKATAFAWVIVALLVVSIAANVFLFLRMQGVLR